MKRVFMEDNIKKESLLSRVDSYLVDTFAGLISFVLSLIGLLLIITTPFLIFTGIGSFLARSWTLGIMYLLVALFGPYIARGLIKVVKENEDKIR